MAQGDFFKLRLVHSSFHLMSSRKKMMMLIRTHCLACLFATSLYGGKASEFLKPFAFPKHFGGQRALVQRLGGAGIFACGHQIHQQQALCPLGGIERAMPPGAIIKRNIVESGIVNLSLFSISKDLVFGAAFCLNQAELYLYPRQKSW